MSAFRQSAFFKVGLALILFYSVYSVIYFFGQAIAGREAYNARKTTLLIDQRQIARLFLLSKDEKNLKSYLDDRVKAHEIDFYLLGKDSNFEQVNMDDAPLEAILDSKKDALTRIDSGYKFEKLEVIKIEEAGTTLIIGNYLGPKNYFKVLFKDYQKSLLGDIGFVIFALFCIIGFYFRDIRQIYFALLQGDRSKMKNIRSGSTESDLLLGALGGYEKVLHSATQKNALLENQVLSGVQVELSSGRKPPYEFFVVMVRTDINQFSTIFNRFPREEFMSTVNAFLLRSSEIIQRYSGLIHEYAGDEVIYYFKASENSDPYLLAAGAIREINLLAASISEITQKSNGYAFTVKSAIAGGELRFGHLVNGYTVAGAPFIETVRILSEITDKEKNSTYFSGGGLDSIKQLCEIHFEKTVQLKGFEHQTSLYSMDGLKRLSFLQEQLPLLQYRRSEEELVSILAWITNLGDQIPIQDFLQIGRSLRNIKFSPTMKNPSEAYIKLLEKYCDVELNDDHKYRLSAILGLAKNFVAKEMASGIIACIERCLHKQDRRIVANALDLLAYFDPSYKTALPKIADDHRITASLLVKDGLVSIDNKLTKRLSELLASGKALHQASALYAMGEIADHYRKIDPVYLSTRLKFVQLLARLPEYALHADEMVSRQALLAAKKYRDDLMLENLHEIFLQTREEKLLARFSAVFSWSHKPQADTVSVQKKAA